MTYSSYAHMKLANNRFAHMHKVEMRIEHIPLMERLPLLAEVLVWCKERFGTDREGTRGRWCKSGWYFYFREEEDAILFKLTWG